MLSFLKSALVKHKILNELQDTTAKANSNASELAQTLNQGVLELYGNFLNEDGTAVNYTAMASSPAFAEFEKSTQLLVHVKLEDFSEDDKKPFFINLYNACLIHGFVRLGVPSSSLTRMKFFSETAYRIGAHSFCLDDMEHGILRANSKSPLTSAPQFSAGDPRIPYCVRQLDPRIHFALVCGAKSCPPIRIFNPENCERALELAATNFCRNNVKFQDETIQLSQIFKWYGTDFASDIVGLLKFVHKYLTPQQQAQLDKILAEKQSAVKIKYLEYDWSVNSM